MRSGLGRLWARARTWVLAYLPERSRSRRPPVRIHTALAVPNAVLRLVVVVIGLGCAHLVVLGPPGWVIVIGLLVGVYFAPGTMVAGALVMAFGLLLVSIRRRTSRACLCSLLRCRCCCSWTPSRDRRR